MVEILVLGETDLIVHSYVQVHLPSQFIIVFAEENDDSLKSLLQLENENFPSIFIYIHFPLHVVDLILTI